MQHRNYYQVLGISNTALFQEIKAAYRKLAKQFHPDKNFGNKTSEEQFKEIQAAYAVLSDPSKRKRYDLKLKYGVASPSEGPRSRPRKQPPRKPSSKRKAPPHSQKQWTKKDSTESKYILVSFFAALVLLYLMIAFSSEKTTPKMKAEMKIQDTSELVEEVKKEKAYQPPVDTLLGRNVFDSTSNNAVSIINTRSFEAIVCLVEKKAPHKVIRNYYFDYGDEYEMKNIPPGEYYLQVYYGKLLASVDEFSMKNFRVFWSAADKAKSFEVSNTKRLSFLLNFYAPSENK